MVVVVVVYFLTLFIAKKEILLESHNNFTLNVRKWAGLA